LAVLAYAVYEATVPEEMSIRTDLLIIWMILGPAIGLSLYRLRYPEKRITEPDSAMDP